MADVAHHDGDKSLTRQPDGAHHAVSDHGRARHIAGILQHRQAQKHQRKKRREGEHHAYATDETIHQQACDQPVIREDAARSGGDGAGDECFQSVL